MKKLAFISLLFLFITTEAMATDLQSDEMVELAMAFESDGLTTENWQVTLKEKFDRNELQDILKNLRNSDLVTVEEDENRINYFFEDTHTSKEITESYNVIIPKDEMAQAELVAVIKGTHWDTTVKENYQLIIDSIKDQYFSKSVETFACLTTGNDGIINSDYFLKELTERLNLQHIKTQSDTVVNSTHKEIIYGYTSLWNQKIMVEDTPVNLQVAVTENGDGNSTYTVGTPILINEY